MKIKSNQYWLLFIEFGYNIIKLSICVPLFISEGFFQLLLWLEPLITPVSLRIFLSLELYVHFSDSQILSLPLSFSALSSFPLPFRRGFPACLVFWKNRILFFFNYLCLTFAIAFTFNDFFSVFFFFLAALSLYCCVWALSSCGEQGLLFPVVASLAVAGRAWGPSSFSSWGTRASLPHGKWDLPRPGITSVSPVLAWAFRKVLHLHLKNSV